MKHTIGIEAQRLFRPKKHGMEVVAFELLRQLQQQPAPFNYQLFVKHDEDRCITTGDHLTVKELPSKPYPYWEQLLLPKAAKAGNISLLHCSSNTAPLFTKIPLLVTIHDVIFMGAMEFSGSAYQNFGNLYRRFIVPRVAKKAAAIITVSEYAKKEIAAVLKTDPEKIHVVYNGLNPAFKPQTGAESIKVFCSKYKLPENYLLHIGNTAPRKNTAGVLKAYQQYLAAEKDPLPLVISGCERSFVEQLAGDQTNPTILKNIFTPGYVDAAELPLLYQGAAIFICPSFSEGFGMPVAESMACGTPVITSNCTSLPEVAGGAALLVNPTEPGEIFSAIIRLLSNAVLYEALKAKGLENAKRFSWVKAAEQTIDIYKKILNLS
ncbi:MAG: glycosyltransferase family 1 protein [Ferruginibacter sp.]